MMNNISKDQQLIDTLQQAKDSELEENSQLKEYGQEEEQEKNAFTQQSYFIQQQKVKSEQDNVAKQAIQKELDYQWLKEKFPKITQTINIENYESFFSSTSITAIQNMYPKYLFILCKLWIRQSDIKQLDQIYEMKYSNWDKIFDFNQPLKLLNCRNFSIEKLQKINKQYQNPIDNELSSKLSMFKINCKNMQIVEQINRTMKFTDFWREMQSIKQQCKSKEIDATLLNHIDALEEFVHIVQSLKQNTENKMKKFPKMKKTIGISIDNIIELCKDPEINIQLQFIQNKIEDIINKKDIQQDNKQKWTFFQKLVKPIFNLDSNLNNSEYLSKKETKKCKYYKQQVKQDQRFSQNHLANPQQIEEFVNACLGIYSVDQKLSIEN